jgi:hypothetical protein
MSERDENKNAPDGFKVLPHYALRLRYLVRPRAVFWVHCYPCDRDASLDIPDLIKRLGPDADIKTMERAVFRCRHCRSTHTKFRVEWLEDAPNLSTDWGG